MDRHDQPAVADRQRLAAQLADRHGPAEQAPRRGRAERHDDLGLDDRAFDLVPPAAALNLIGVRPLVQPPLAALLVLEMLDRVGDEDLAAIDTRVGDREVEHAAGWPDKGMTLAILLIARLLAHHHDPRVLRPFARHHLGRAAIEGAAGARGFGVAQRREAADVRHFAHDHTTTLRRDCSAYVAGIL